MGKLDNQASVKIRHVAGNDILGKILATKLNNARLFEGFMNQLRLCRCCICNIIVEICYVY